MAIWLASETANNGTSNVTADPFKSYMNVPYSDACWYYETLAMKSVFFVYFSEVGGNYSFESLLRHFDNITPVIVAIVTLCIYTLPTMISHRLLTATLFLSSTFFVRSGVPSYLRFFLILLSCSIATEGECVVDGFLVVSMVVLFIYSDHLLKPMMMAMLVFGCKFSLLTLVSTVVCDYLMFHDFEVVRLQEAYFLTAYGIVNYYLVGANFFGGLGAYILKFIKYHLANYTIT